MFQILFEFSAALRHLWSIGMGLFLVDSMFLKKLPANLAALSVNSKEKSRFTGSLIRAVVAVPHPFESFLIKTLPFAAGQAGG